jgi:DNA modification methylase
VIIKANSLFIPLKDKSVNCIITSPPYWSLRKYDIPDLIWDEVDECKHEWIDDPVPGEKSGKPGPNATVGARFEQDAIRRREPTNTCGRCGAWRGQLGLEPTIDLYLSHLLQVTKEIWRVLRKDGVFFINIGDSYAGSWGDSGHRPERTGLEGHQRAKETEWFERQGHPSFNPPTSRKQTGLKPKDLCLIPFRLALVLQAQGWWVRSDIIWAKPNPMPESVRDRPTRSHEYVFLLTKSEKYFWDQDAVREPHTWVDASGKRIGSNTIGQIAKRKRFETTMAGGGTNARTHSGSSMNHPNGRNIRSVWTIATQPYPEAHYATFPEALVERCIKAGCPKGGIVLDPFCGSGTVIRVAEQLNRKAIGLDLGYQSLSVKRVQNIQVELAL